MHEDVLLAHKVWGGRHLTRGEIEFFLKEVRTARFCSHNNDETIHAAPVWFKYENGKIVVLTPEHSCKARNGKRNKNVSILIDVEKPPRGVLIYGKAELDNEFDIKSTAIWLCEKYMSKEKAKDQWRSAAPPATNWLKITVKPERMTSFDYSQDEAYRTTKCMHGQAVLGKAIEVGQGNFGRRLPSCMLLCACRS